MTPETQKVLVGLSKELCTKWDLTSDEAALFIKTWRPMINFLIDCDLDNKTIALNLISLDVCED